MLNMEQIGYFLYMESQEKKEKEEKAKSSLDNDLEDQDYPTEKRKINDHNTELY